jgi:hypothetical protein
MGLRHETTGLLPTSEHPRGTVGVMRWRPVIVARASGVPRRSAGAVLGSDHPLARAIEARESVVRQLIAVAAVLAGGMIDLGEGVAWATMLVASAVVVLLGLAVIVAASMQRERDRALNLILEGRETVPVAAVQRQRRRLLDRRTRAILARNLAAMIDQASNRRTGRACRVRPLFDVGVVAAVAPDIRAVIVLLHAEDAPARGVAFVERLLTDVRTPLYGNQVEALREELNRVRLYLIG